MNTSPFGDQPSASAQPREPFSPASTQPPARRRRWWVGPVVVLVIFLAGFVPMWLKAGRHAGERDVAQRELQLMRLENLAAATAIDARRGEYEAARHGASLFFTALRKELDRGPDWASAPAQLASLRTMLSARDALITLLARSDPASGERLTELYLACRKVLRDRGR